MDWDLDEQEQRVLGALIEKSLATPDYYPMTVSGLTAACNQRSNREPVMDLSEAQIRSALDGLMARYLVRERSPAGSRSVKFAHRLDDELGLRFKFTRADLAVLCLLLLRGPQTVGELRGRSGRMYEFASVAEVESTLNRLMTGDEPQVTRLPVEPGRREARYAHLLGVGAPQSLPPDRDELAPMRSIPDDPDFHAALSARVAELEEIVALLKTEVDELKSRQD
ncbi:MAG: YceH family protein [Gammaproteobacteria bacterium]|nr:YceH family protein [Gammaproteobacteria bacterium]